MAVWCQVTLLQSNIHSASHRQKAHFHLLQNPYQIYEHVRTNIYIKNEYVRGRKISTVLLTFRVGTGTFIIPKVKRTLPKNSSWRLGNKSEPYTMLLAANTGPTFPLGLYLLKQEQ